MKQVVVCKFKRVGSQVQAMVSSIARGARAPSMTMKAGMGDCLDEAIGHAIGLPGVRFACERDELDAEIAAFRGRALTVMARNNELCSLGLA